MFAQVFLLSLALSHFHLLSFGSKNAMKIKKGKCSVYGFFYFLCVYVASIPFVYVCMYLVKQK